MAATRTFKPVNRKGGKQVPAGSSVQHGTRSGYLHGCRCGECVAADHTYQAERYQAIKAGTWTGRTKPTTTTKAKEAT